MNLIRLSFSKPCRISACEPFKLELTIDQQPMSLILLCKFGNEKAGDDTLLLNMGSATRCAAATKCRVLLERRKCYPKQVERLHPVVKIFRDRQEAYWLATAKEQIAEDILRKIDRRPTPTRYLRFNESGDFWSQECVDKLSYIAKALKSAANITAYGFSARSDLDFSKAAFLVKGSGHDHGNNGRCMVVSEGDAVPDDHMVCPENCRVCNVCMRDSKVNIAFIER